MKFIKRHIKKLCPDVDIKLSTKGSNSEYYRLNEYLKIRLSDHLSPISSDNLDINVITMVDSEDKFIVIYKDTRIPLVRTRKEIITLITQLYEYSRIRQIAKEKSDEAKSRLIHSYAYTLTDKATDILNDIKKRFKDLHREYNRETFINELHNIGLYETITSKALRSHINSFYGTKMTDEHFIQFILDINSIKDKDTISKELITARAEVIVKSIKTK